MAKSLDNWIGVSSYIEQALYYRPLGHKFMNLAVKDLKKIENLCFSTFLFGKPPKMNKTEKWLLIID
jgi:hypothetical protein